MKWNLKHIILIIIFLLLQIIWFNQISLFGKYTPIIYLYPFLVFSINKDQSLNLIIGFLSGLILDIFSNTGGVFSATTVFIIYLKKIYFMINKNPSQNLEDLQISKLSFIQKILYFSTFIFIGLTLGYLFESFNIKLTISKLGYIFINTILSLFFYIFIDVLFSNNK